MRIEAYNIFNLMSFGENYRENTHKAHRIFLLQISTINLLK
ncbi:MAG: hypothetical protein BAJALOKI1v1_2420006 [Promethearchaeota archaeon]|nr:MAG: hypothetical protein BAJALOKI1v1_2420006 [Candidatus Lokiarchaeota archaeon]